MDEIDIDRAIERETANVQKQIDHILSKAARGEAAESATHCFDCGDAIPEKRRAAIPGCKLCVNCKSSAER